MPELLETKGANWISPWLLAESGPMTSADKRLVPMSSSSDPHPGTSVVLDLLLRRDMFLIQRERWSRGSDVCVGLYFFLSSVFDTPATLMFGVSII